MLAPGSLFDFFLQWFQSGRKQDIHRHASFILKMAVEGSHASKTDGGQINKAFGYFKKIRSHADSPELHRGFSAVCI